MGGGMGGGMGRRDDRACHNCGRTGHLARDCRIGGGARGYDAPRGRAPRAPRAAKVAGQDDVCNRCNQTGHWARDCPEPDTRPESERGRQPGDKDKCRNCGAEGHFARDCPEPKDTSCRICKQEGHFARECPQKNTAAAANMDADLDNYMKEGAKETGEA